MANSDAIWNRARVALTVVDERGQEDSYLWEHSRRVAQCALLIACLPGVRNQKPDEAAVLAGGLYHDAGWIMRLREGEIERNQILSRPGTETHRELGAGLMQRDLEGLLSPESIRTAAQAIQTLNEREINTIEGQIVTDAENLNELGVLSLWPIIRRGADEGRDVEYVLKTWRRQREFRFWDARLKDSFHFDAVRTLAQHRLESFGRLMGDLDEQHRCADLAALVDQPVPEAKLVPGRV